MTRKHEAIEVGSGDVFVDLGFAKQLSWKDTFKAMAREREDWSDFEGTVADGLDPNAGERNRLDHLSVADAARVRRLIVEMYGE